MKEDEICVIKRKIEELEKQIKQFDEFKEKYQEEVRIYKMVLEKLEALRKLEGQT